MWSEVGQRSDVLFFLDLIMSIKFSWEEEGRGADFIYHALYHYIIHLSLSQFNVIYPDLPIGSYWHIGFEQPIDKWHSLIGIALIAAIKQNRGTPASY